MATETVEALVEGGRATAAPPLGPALGPMGVNIGQVVVEINKKTASFNGMQVPVKIKVDTETKQFEISIGTPPASALIKKEAGVQKGSGNPLQDKVADLKIEQIIKIAKMKEDSLLGRSLKEKVKEVIGTCDSMGILVEGKQARETIADINKGAFASEIASGKTELSAEELQELMEERKRLEQEIKERREEFLATGNRILAELKGKTRGEIKAAMVEAGVPTQIIDELMPVEEAAAAKGEAKPGAEAKPAAAPKAAEKK